MGRGHVEILHSPDLPWGGPPGEGWPVGVSSKVLSRDAETGALTALLRFDAGYRRPSGHLTGKAELLVLSGTLRLGGGTRGFGWYGYAPAGATLPPLAVDGGAVVLLKSPQGAPDFAPGPGPGDGEGRLSIDTETLPWTVSPIPGPPPGMVSKTLRHDPETGERTWLSACVPTYVYPRLEYHDCVEESFCIAGRITIGTSGELRPGSYFWRPPYVTHGPFYSPVGRMNLIWTDKPLVNHFVDDPRRTPEENRRDAEAAGPPRDFVRESRKD